MAKIDISPESLSRAAVELSNAETILTQFQSSLSEKIARELDLTSDEIMALQNIDLVQQTVGCVALYLLQLSGQAKEQTLVPADIAARLLGAPAKPSSEESYLF